MIPCLGLLTLSTASMAQSADYAGNIDLTLDKAIGIALAENPTIRVADTEIQLKQVADKEAWQKLLPTADINLSLSHAISVAEIKTGMGKFKMGLDGTTTATGALAVNLPLFAPAIYQSMKLTKEDIQLAQEKARGSRQDLINQVKLAYFQALYAQDAYEVTKKAYDVAKKNSDLAEAMFKVGSVSEYDKISAEVQTQSSNSTMVSTETAKNLALLQLKVLMGITANVEININDSLKAYEKELTLSNTKYDDSEFANNSSLRTLDMNMGLLERSRKLLKTGFMPTFALSYQYQYMSYSNENWNFFKYSYSPSSTIAFAVSIPIFHADNWTKLKSNKLQISQLNDNSINVRNQLTVAAEAYSKNMASNLVLAQSNKNNVKMAEKAMMIATKRYEVGQGTMLELNMSEVSYTNAELSYNQAIFDFLQNKANLDYTLGRDNY